jgi:hypothetical protein
LPAWRRAAGHFPTATCVEDALRAGQFPSARHTCPAGQRGRGRWLIPFGDALNWRNRRSIR